MTGAGCAAVETLSNREVADCAVDRAEIQREHK
jgi:hypothetical protein